VQTGNSEIAFLSTALVQTYRRRPQNGQVCFKAA